MSASAPASEARVIANFGARVAVRPAVNGQPLAAHPLSRLPLLVAGDRVRLEPVSARAGESGSPQAAGDAWRITTLLERHSVLERADRRGQPRALAANLTHLAIVSAIEPGIDCLLIDQFCVAAAMAGVGTLVILNKADLLDGAMRREVDDILRVYRDAGAETALVDTKADHGLDPLLPLLEARVVVLVGASGVGKSSIADRLLPDRDIRIGALSEATGLGAHTTTVTCWYDTAAGGALIDSPGVRRFTVPALDLEAVRRGYGDIARAGEHCRFANCRHLKEPGCAVRDAVEDGTIAIWRLEHFRRLIAEL